MPSEGVGVGVGGGGGGLLALQWAFSLLFTVVHVRMQISVLVICEFL